MAKACSNLFSHDHGFKASHETSKEALTFALLETVRLVLEGREAEEEEKYAGDPGLHDHHTTSSEHTSSDSYPPIAQPRKILAPKSGVPGGPCAHCGASESPQWRRPLTKKVVLCNACGIYYSRHHSLPKRKKMPGNKHAGEEEHDGEEEHVGAADDEPMMCDPLPAQLAHSEEDDAHHHHVHQPSTTAAGRMQCEELKPEATVHVHASTPTTSVSMACASPARSCGSPMHYGSGVAAPPSTPKKRTDEYLDSLFDAHAEDSLAKRAMKRAATAVHTASHATATPVISTGNSPPVGSPASDSFLMPRRPAITTSLATSLPVSREHSRMSVIMQALLLQQAQQAPVPGPVYHAVSNLSGMLLAAGPSMCVPMRSMPVDAGFQPQVPSSMPLAEQSAENDVGMILIPTSTCRGPRSKNSSRQGSPVCHYMG